MLVALVKHSPVYASVELDDESCDIGSKSLDEQACPDIVLTTERDLGAVRPRKTNLDIWRKLNQRQCHGRHTPLFLLCRRHLGSLAKATAPANSIGTFDAHI